MLKFVVLLAPLLILSGCCQVFGICTSADVHTSIDRPEDVAQQEHFPATSRILLWERGWQPQVPPPVA